MNTRTPARIAARSPQSTMLIALAVVFVAISGALGYQSLAASLSAATDDGRARSLPATPATEPRPEDEGRQRQSPDRPPPPEDRPRGARPGAPGAADGAGPDVVTVFADDIPAVANLDPDLLGALRQAATDAEGDGVEFSVNSGWRTPEYQEQLLREAIATYGSAEEAARWVATAETSAHVSGDAVDLGPVAATTWLAEHGAGYGLCQTYRNEPWHYELRPDAIDYGCPPMYDDPTHDPRMQP